MDSKKIPVGMVDRDFFCENQLLAHQIGGHIGIPIAQDFGGDPVVISRLQV